VLQHDFAGFYAEEISSREELGYPPFSRLVLLELKGPDENRVRCEAERLAKLLRDAGVSVPILGPSPAVIARIRSQYRWHLLLKNPRAADPSGARLRTDLQRALAVFHSAASRSVTLTIDVDPVGLL
jgi:primosomal protein N' (replication factor Y)